MKPKTCKTCGKEFKPSRPIQLVCGLRCALKYKQAKEKEKKEAMKENILTRSDYVQILQRLINKIVRDIDFGNDCISCGKPPKKVNAGHFYATSAEPNLRFHLFNIWYQCEYCNTYKHGNLTQYASSLNNLGLLDFITDERIRWHDLKLDKERLKAAIKTAKTIKIEAKPRTVEERIELRKQLNESIGIYV